MTDNGGRSRKEHRAAPMDDIPPEYRLSTYDYRLPQDLIAQEPVPERDASRLLVVDQASGRLRHHRFKELPGLLSRPDLLVLNETRVVPAALSGFRESGGRVELLVLDPARTPTSSESQGNAVRVCMTKSSKPLRPGTVIRLDRGPELLVQELAGPGRVLVRFPVGEQGFPEFLERHGSPPLPPYIRHGARREERDRDRYQTVYADTAGSVAAPTAGLHFTQGLLEELETAGIEIVKVLLHVGPGTFKPVRTEDIRLHRMESEFYRIPENTAERVTAALQEGRRVVAVGTTTVRALESAAAKDGVVRPGKGTTELFIGPGYDFRVVSSLVTNFHLPCSTLLMLVCALGGRDLILSAYGEAIREGYRFYSYGDASLII